MGQYRRRNHRCAVRINYSCARLRSRKEDRELTITGPYAYVRNPLYLGSILLGVGFAIASRDIWVGVFSRCLLRRHLRSGDPGRAELSARDVSRLCRIHCSVCRVLLPRKLWFAGVTNGFSRELYFRHREYNSLLGAAAIVVVLIAKILLLPG